MIDLDDLEKKAREATPGPWSFDAEDNHISSDGRNTIAQPRSGHSISAEQRDRNGNYIAAANPFAILDLIARCRKAEAEVERLKLIEDNALKVCGQLDEVVLAMPYDYLDPPDGGNVSLGEQVKRMYSEVKELRANVEGEHELAQKLAKAEARAAEWQPIKTYDKLKTKPAHAAFWFEGTSPARGQIGKYGLTPMMRLERYAGSRVCTHWMPLPAAPSPEGE